MSSYITVETIRACVESEAFQSAFEEICERYKQQALAAMRSAVRKGDAYLAAFNEGRATAAEEFGAQLAHYVENSKVDTR